MSAQCRTKDKWISEIYVQLLGKTKIDIEKGIPQFALDFQIEFYKQKKRVKK